MTQSGESSTLTEADALRVAVGKADCPSPHSLSNKVGRVLWAVAWLILFRPSPRILFGWRRWILRLFGAEIGANARISPSARIWAPWNLAVGEEAAVSHDVDLYCVARITIGSHATVSQYAMLCTASHDITDPHMRLTMSPIVIGDQAWVCARAFVSPGIEIGMGGVAGAAAVVTHDIPAWAVAVGNPARVIKTRVLKAD
jgi:putative colanic acid biosynthesis acetyltransferase WcaF